MTARSYSGPWMTVAFFATFWRPRLWYIIVIWQSRRATEFVQLQFWGLSVCAWMQYLMGIIAAAPKQSYSSRCWILIQNGYCRLFEWSFSPSFAQDLRVAFSVEIFDRSILDGSVRTQGATPQAERTWSGFSFARVCHYADNAESMRDWPLLSVQWKGQRLAFAGKSFREFSFESAIALQHGTCDSVAAFGWSWQWIIETYRNMRKNSDHAVGLAKFVCSC